ncbi:hypothetical protein FRC09_000197 [Ceratobasidium sp. 395]|nr:hypothetical protein FRC09_000197 [Ceratobasidium sp. 395]
MTLVQQRQQSVSSASSADAVHCLPPRFVPNPLVSGLTIRFIMSQYEPLFEMMFFKPIKSHIKLVRGKFISRIISSSLTHMSMLLGANMFQCLKQGGHASARRFVPWIDRCYRLCVTSKHDVVFEDFVGRLSGALELTFLKFIVADANSGRALMRRIAPTFMQIACADPSLWPHDPSSSGISLAHVLVSGHNELTRFVFIDMVSSLTLGVTPLIEYDTSHPVIRTCEVHPLEWVHGCPLEFAFAILKINTWAAQNATGRTAPAEIWEEIEATAWAWTPRCDYGPDHESRRIMARFAGQEGWRHAVLIYLYMRMCGANSHDARVQASVQQISRLCGVVSPSLSIGLHFVVPLLLAAICTPSEAQRNRLRAAIAEPGENKIWLLQTVQLAFVLDHLWHGAAANGAAVTWDDYVSSRRAVVPIDI